MAPDGIACDVITNRPGYVAKQHIVAINIPMAEALRKMLVRNECPVCKQEIEYHSTITLDSNGQIVTCSNVEREKK